MDVHVFKFRDWIEASVKIWSIILKVAFINNLTHLFPRTEFSKLLRGKIEFLATVWFAFSYSECLHNWIIFDIKKAIIFYLNSEKYNNLPGKCLLLQIYSSKLKKILKILILQRMICQEWWSAWSLWNVICFISCLYFGVLPQNRFLLVMMVCSLAIFKSLAG